MLAGATDLRTLFVAGGIIVVVVIRGSGGGTRGVFCSALAKINIKMWEALVAEVPLFSLSSDRLARER